MNAEKAELEAEKGTVVAFPKAAPKPPDGGDWLGGLSIGTCFLCRRKNLLPHENMFLMEEFWVVNKSRMSTLLFSNLNEERYYRVDTSVFSKIYNLIEVLQNINKADRRNQQEDDDDGNRTD